MASRVGIYVRVSTQDQSCELQRRELTQYCQARGWTILRVYEDKASGTTSNRIMLQELLADARARKIDIVVCWKMDRFARSLKDLVGMLQEFTDLGVSFCSLKDAVDLSTSTGRLMIHIIGAFAQFEADLIRERVRAGLSNARRKGQRLGRPPTIDQDRVVRLRSTGMSLTQIAEAVGGTKSAVAKTLRRRGGRG